MELTSSGYEPSIYLIRSRQRETRDTFSLDLVPRDPEQTIRFLPGQFMMLWAFGRGEAAISISGNPAQERNLVHTIRAVGSVTNYFKSLQIGEELGVRGPFGTPWPVDEAKGKDVLLVAGGIGLAPLRPVIYHLLSNRKDYGRIICAYGTRTPADLLYKEEWLQWQSAEDSQWMLSVDSASATWKGRVGVVTQLLERLTLRPDQSTAFLCGPEIMMRYAVQSLQRVGIPEDQLYLSLERNMQCGMGLCGHCQIGPYFVCKDGPVFPWPQVADLFEVREA